MIFTRLKLNNFKSYKNTTITFDKGISVIVGENGAGKSTILEAISFALFKRFTAKKIDDLVRNNADTMSLELDFISSNKEYRIIRDKTKTKMKSTLLTKTSSEGQFITLCTGDKEVSKNIKEILDIDSDLFLNAIYIRQGEIAELVDKNPADKKLLIGKLLGIDSLEKSWKNLLQFITHYENELAELKGKLYSSSNLKEEYEEKKEELISLKDRGHELETQIEEVNQFLNEISEDKREMEREKEIYETQVNNLDNEKSNLERLEKDKHMVQDNLDQIFEAEEKIARLEKYVSKLDLYLDFEKSVVSIQKLKADEDEIEEKLDSIANQKEIIADQKEGYDNFLTSDEEINNLTNQKIKFEKELASLTQLEKDKKDLLSTVENNRNDIEKFFSKSREMLLDYGLSQEIVDDIDELNDLEEVNSNYINEISNKIKDLSSDIISKNEEIVVFKQNIKSSQKPLEELEGVDNKCPVCQSDIDSEKKLELIGQYNKEIEENEKLISEYEENVCSLTENKESYEEKLEKLQDLSKDIIEYKHKLTTLNEDSKKLKNVDEDLESKELISDELGEIILRIASLKEKRESYRQSYDNYNQAKGALDVLGDEEKTQYKLKQVRNEIDNHVANIKLAMEQDPHLSGDINTKELEDRIEDLKKKNEEYNQLKGFVQNKNALTNQLDSIKEDIGVSMNQIDITNNKIQVSAYDSEKYEQIIVSYEMYERRNNTLSEDLAGVKGRARELIENVNNLSEKLRTNKKFQQEYDDISDYINLLSHIRNLYSKNGIQKDLRNISRPLIQKYTKDFFNEFNFNYSDLTLDEDYEVTVYGPEGESSMTMVSGGEKIAIALALRLGITQAISKGELDTILLDEPTIHLDNSRRHELINLLKDMSVLPQMIIVTHEPQLENAADNLIKVEKENGISKIVM